MKILRFICAVSFALAFVPALFAFQEQEPALVRSLGATSLSAAQQRSLANQSVLTGTPHQALRPLPRPHFGATSAVTTVSLPNATFPVGAADTFEHGFSGIDSRDSNFANGGGIAGIGEPPDQGLAANGTQVFEVVNLALRIFTTTGSPLSSSIGLAAFFGVPDSNGSSSNNLTDPRVFFDPMSQRFFMSVLEYQTDNTTGAFVGSEDLLAVSQSSNALGNYFLYQINACPSSAPECLADQPLIGVNDDGFFFSNNVFNMTGNFVFARITALNKTDLLNNTPVFGIAFDLPLDFSIEPALPAPGQTTTAVNGIEYFTESLDNGSGASALRIFAMPNTERLESNGITVMVQNDFASEFYTNPVPASQKAGDYPLGQHFGDPEESLNTDDDRMLQLYYGDGKLYTTLETAMTGPRTGAAWFIIQPSATATSVSAHVVHQGYIGISNGSVMYPAFAVNNSGAGIIGFSFSGTNYYPSAGYVHVYSNGTLQMEVRRAAAGQNPEDGFSGYSQYGGNGVARWGDYSAAFISPDGHFWFAAEYIPNPIAHPRTQYTNWGTFVSRVQ